MPFGRPFLRRIDRPRVRIPPRKRPRLTEEEDEWNNFTTQRNSPDPILLRNCTNAHHGIRDAKYLFDAGLQDDFQDEDDQEFVMEDLTEENDETTEEDEELASEVHDLVRDGGCLFSSNSQSPEACRDSKSPNKASPKRSVEDTNKRGLGIQVRNCSSSSERLDLDGKNLWIGPYENPLLDEHYEDIIQSRTKRVKRSHPQGMTKSAPALRNRSSLREVQRSSNSSRSRSVRFEVEGLATPATIIAEQDTSDSDDEDFEAPSESTSGSSESDKENVSPGDAALDSSLAGPHLASVIGLQGGILKSATDCASPFSGISSSHPSSSEPANDYSWKTSSSSGASYSDSVSEPTSDSDSDSDSSSDSTPDSEYHSAASESNVFLNHTHKTPLLSTKIAKASAKSKKPITPSTALQSVSRQTPPGQGSGVTKKRNRRRRLTRNYKNHIKKGVIPSTFTRMDFVKWEEENRASQENKEKPVQAQSEQTHIASTAIAKDSTEMDLTAAIQAKKSELLRSLGGVIDGQVASNETLQTMVDGHSHVTSNKTLQTMGDEPDYTMPTTQRVVVQDEIAQDEIENLPRNDVQELNPVPISTSARSLASKGAIATPQSDALDVTPNKRRARLDVTSSRRMLFGSLGVRAPNTQEEADAVRQKLSANIRIAPQPKPDAALKLADTEIEDVDADDSWKAKITLKAVECCHEGIELSTPPFPFVQRWDPRQKGDFKNRKLSKKQRRRASQQQKRRTSQHYGNSGTEVLHGKIFVIEERESAFEAGAGDAHDNDQSALYPTLSEEYQLAANEQLLRDSRVLPTNTDTEVVVDDSPQIPTDIETYSTLGPGNAVQGSVIAFKQLEVSARTCWQPQVSDYRIGTIENVLRENEAWTLCVRLVKNDQNDKARKYDAVTGERIYGRFEMPMSSEEEDDTYLEISFDDMIEPKLMQPSPFVTGQVEGHEQPPVESGSLIQIEETPQEDSLVGPKVIREEQHYHSTSVVEESLLQERQHDSQNDEKPLSSDGPDSVSRKEVSLLIKGAGFRTSIDPEAARELEDLRDGGEQELQNSGENDDYDHDSVGSLSFNGFASSPPRMYNDQERMDRNREREMDVELDENEGEEDYSEQKSDEVDNEEQDSKSGFKVVVEKANQSHAPNADSYQSHEEELDQSSHSMGWYAANLGGNANDHTPNHENFHGAAFGTTEASNLEGVSSDKVTDNTSLSNVDGTTEISNLDGASYDMIGTQAAPKLGTSSPNPLPSPIHMPTHSKDLPSAQSSDQLPETIPPTSTSKTSQGSSPHQQLFRNILESPSRSVIDPADQGSSPIHRSKAEKTLAMRGGQDLKRKASFDSPSNVESHKSSGSESASDSDSEFPFFETMFHSQRSSARSPIQLSSDPPRPESSSPPRRPLQSDRISLNITKDFRSPDEAKRKTGFTASQQKIKRESFSQSQTRIKEEQLSQHINLIDDNSIDDHKNLDYEDYHRDLGTQIPKRAPEKANTRMTENSTRPKEAVIVDLTQDGDLQSPGGSEYGAGKSARGVKGKRNGERATQSLGGEAVGSDIIRAARKRVVERTRSRV